MAAIKKKIKTFKNDIRSKYVKSYEGKSQNIHKNIYKKTLKNVAMSKKKSKRKYNEQPKKFIPEVYNDWSLITYKNITEGFVVLGCIKRVTQYHLIVALPNRMVGYVAVRDLSISYAKLLTEVSDGVLNAEDVLMLQDLYTPGEFIVVQIKSVVNKNGRINLCLTTQPSKTNIAHRGSQLHTGTIIQCSVTSETENGFIMDTGLPSVRAAFLQKKFVAQTCGVGKVLLCFILSVVKDESMGLSNIKLSSQTELLTTILLDEENSFNSFCPGSAADVEITMVADYGLRVMCGNIEGIVSKQHLPFPYQKTSDFKIGKVLRARVLYSTEIPNIIYFSTLPLICSMGTEGSSAQSLGNMETIENATLYGINKYEAYFYLTDDLCGVCAANQLKDSGKIDKIKIGDRKQCRVLDYWPMDDIYIVGVKDSLINEKAYTPETVNVGDDVTMKIIHVVQSGVVVKVGKFLTGFVPKIHLTKLTGDYLEEVRGKVLSIKEDNKIIFTLRKDLIDSELAMVSDFNSQSEGMTVTGVVFGIKDNGLNIEFFNLVNGFLPYTLTPPGMSTDHYKVGSLIECKVKKHWTNKSALLTMEEEWDDVEGTKSWMGSKKIIKTKKKKTVIRSNSGKQKKLINI